MEKRDCLSAFLLSGILVLAVSDWTFGQAQTIATAANPSSYSTQRLQNANHCLNAWLVKTGQGQRWRRQLMLNVLESQSAQGEHASIVTLSQIQARFSTGASDLEQPAFQNVRIALEHQIKHLSASRVADIFAGLTMARGQYHEISVAEMVNQRDLAKQSLLALRDYWNETVQDQSLAQQFADLQLNEAIAFLDEVKFELAPEVSVGKMTLKIREVEGRLQEVVRAIDALPLETDEADQGQEEESKSDMPADEAEQEPGGASRDELEKKQTALEAEISDLKKQRNEINKLDGPRQADRRKTFNQLRKFENNFVKLSETQGDPYFFSAQLDFERFVQTYGWGTSDNLQNAFLARIESLEADLLEIDGPESRIAAGKVGDHLRWLENANQVPHLVTAIRAKYSLPNAFVSVSSKFLNQIGGQSVNEVQCIREQMDGRLVQGTANTYANVAIDLQNDPNQVHASIHLTGNMTSSTYVDQGKIRAFATASGMLEGRRSIYANVGGLYAGTPKVAANIQAYFSGTSSKLRLVDRIANKKFNEVKRKSEGAAARKAEDQLIMKFGEQTNEAINNGSKELTAAQDKLIPKTNLLPEAYVRSFPSEIMLIGRKVSISSLGAQKMPGAHKAAGDVLVRIHDSMPSNFLDNIFAGKTFTNDELATELGSITGEAPDTLVDKPNAGKDESFSITFATVRPIQIEFEDNRFSVVVSGRSFSQGDKQINEGLKIMLRFKIVKDGEKLMFVRDGEAEIDYLEPEKKRPVTVAFRSFLIGKLNPKDGAEELSAELPDNLLPVEEVELLQDSEIANEMLLTQCRIENGWFYLGWNRRRALDTSPLSFDTPAIWDENTTGQSTSAVGDQPATNAVPVEASTEVSFKLNDQTLVAPKKTSSSTGAKSPTPLHHFRG